MRLPWSFPSLWYEVFPSSRGQAFQQRTPVIARNLGGMREIVEESGGGFVYGSDDELEQKLAELLDKPLAREYAGSAGI